MTRFTLTKAELRKMIEELEKQRRQYRMADIPKALEARDQIAFLQRRIDRGEYIGGARDMDTLSDPPTEN